MIEFDYDKVMRDKVVIHCDTEEKANSLLKWADSKGVKWCSGERLIDHTSYDAHRCNTCYCLFDGTYSSYDYLKNEGYTILTYEEALTKEEKAFPRRMMVWDTPESKCERLVLGNFNGMYLAVLKSNERNFDIGEDYTADTWKHAEDLPTKKMRPMTHTEVFKAIRNGAVVRCGDDNFTIQNHWCVGSNKPAWQMCFNYTGTDSDVWQKMEVEE